MENIIVLHHSRATADVEDQWSMLSPDLTEQQVLDLRTALIKQYSVAGIDIKEFTCDTCTDKMRCPLAFDAYNTEDDCLMVK